MDPKVKSPLCIIKNPLHATTCTGFHSNVAPFDFQILFKFENPYPNKKYTFTFRGERTLLGIFELILHRIESVKKLPVRSRSNENKYLLKLGEKFDDPNVRLCSVVFKYRKENTIMPTTLVGEIFIKGSPGKWELDICRFNK